MAVAPVTVALMAVSQMIAGSVSGSHTSARDFHTRAMAFQDYVYTSSHTCHLCSFGGLWVTTLNYTTNSTHSL